METTSYHMNKKIFLCLVILGIPILLGVASNAIQGWHYVFDDAFITYRYAKNLALGHGITWNPGHAPTEGYTNFLLVIILAPFIRFGLDPLLVTRFLSYMSVIGMAVILFSVARRRHGCPTPAALMIGSLVFFSPQTRNLCLVGLETLIYALFLLATFHIGIEVLHARRIRHSVLFSVFIIFTMLLRPEAALLYPVMLFLYCVRRGTNQASETKPLLLGLIVLLALGSAYLAWKLIHFGHLLPNPFYIKAASTSLISPIGMNSVLSFVGANTLFIALSFAGLLFSVSDDTDPLRKSKVSVAFGFCLVFMYACFIARTDTLMDIHGRFMYPLLPILIYLAIPAFAHALETFESLTDRRSLLIYSGIVFSFLLIFGPRDVLSAYSNAKGLVPDSGWKTSNSLMQKEFRIAKTLSSFPDIRNVRIAFADSGVIPYHTDSVWLDVVGLNDSFIARSRNREQLLNYFFRFQPDLVIHPGGKNFAWINYGHGPLGNYADWADDPRWDNYMYVGTGKTTGNIYDLQFFIRKSGRYQAALKDFLEKYVLDGRYEPLPYQIGTWIPDKKNVPKWIPNTTSR